MRTFSRIIITASLLLFLALPATSLGAPGDNAQEDQYVENVPDEGGGQPSGGPSGTDSGAGVSPGTSAALGESGADGAAVTELAGGERANGGGGNGASEPGNASSTGGTTTSDEASSGNSSVIDSISGSVDSLSDSEGGGLGIWLVVIIGAVAIGGIVFTLSRGRTGTTTS